MKQLMALLCIILVAPVIYAVGDCDDSNDPNLAVQIGVSPQVEPNQEFTANFDATLFLECVDNHLASDSEYNDGHINWRITFGDGTIIELENQPTSVYTQSVQHTYTSSPGTAHTITLEVFFYAATMPIENQDTQNYRQITVATEEITTCNPACGECQTCDTASDTCVDDPETQCTEVPSPECQDENTLRTYGPKCKTDTLTCIYPMLEDVPCDYGCSNGACNPSLSSTTPRGVSNASAVATAGKAHFCGDLGIVWEYPADMPQGGKDLSTFHSLCDYVETYEFTIPPEHKDDLPEENIPTDRPYNYTCSVDNKGFRWFNTDLEGVSLPELRDTGDSEDVWNKYIVPYVRSHSAIDEAILDEGAAACVNGELAPAITKYSPPPTLHEGVCAVSQCHDHYTEGDEEKSFCLAPGATSSDNKYVCLIRPGSTSAEWTSKVALLAERMINKTPENNDFILNCGEEDFTTNIEGEISDNTYGYCQLARMKNGVPTKILLGIAFPTDASDNLPRFAEELNRRHTIIGGYDATTPGAYNNYAYIDFDPDLGYGYFTSNNQLSSNNEHSLLAQFKTFYQAVFTFIMNGAEYPTNKDTGNHSTLISKTAEKIYVYQEDGVRAEYAVEWTKVFIPDIDRTVKRQVIIYRNNGEMADYNDARWRRIIQSRTQGGISIVPTLPSTTI